MLAQALTITTCQRILGFLRKKRRWTVARIARVISAPPAYVRRIEAGKQSFQVADIDALAKASRLQPAILIFRSMQLEDMSPELHDLYDLTKREIRRHQEFRRVLL